MGGARVVADRACLPFHHRPVISAIPNRRGSCPTPATMRRLLANIGRPTLSVRSLLVLIVFLAMALALAVQQHRAAIRIRTLRSELAEAQAIPTAYEKMHGLFGDRGIYLLKTAKCVETLSVGRGAGYPRTPTGMDLDDETAAQLRSEILDFNNYSYLYSDDMPNPRSGFRFRDGHASLDILVSLEGSSRNSPHADLFAIINNEDGTHEYRGYVCTYSKALSDLLAAVLHQDDDRQ